MKLRMDSANPFWWFWVITLILIVCAVAGWTPGYYLVMTVSAVQVIVFLFRDRNVMAFPFQVRFVYLAVTLIGLWETGRLLIYLLLLLGTAMVVFFGRCSISMLLKPMPWNRNRAPALY